MATVNKKIGFLRLLLGVAKGRGLIDVNPAEGAELPLPKRAVELRKPYSPEQMKSVMAATDGVKESDPAMYWLPRLARWTGARLNELHQLRREDVQEREGVPGLMITDEGEHGEGAAMRLKNEGSRRWVPLAEPVRDFAEWVSTRSAGRYSRQGGLHGIVSRCLLEAIRAAPAQDPQDRRHAHHLPFLAARVCRHVPRPLACPQRCAWPSWGTQRAGCPGFMVRGMGCRRVCWPRLSRG
ncbi:hypothetical protein ACU4HD_12730 [Cupriavidus basilensis]